MYTFSTMCGNDLSTTRVKSRTTCYILRVEEREALLRLIAIFGMSAIIGVRKKPPNLSKRLPRTESKVTARGGVQMLDVVNLVDVMSNAAPQNPNKVTYWAEG